MCVYEVCVTCVRGVCACEVCVCEECVCEVGVDTQQSFAAILCMGYYKFGGGVGRQGRKDFMSWKNKLQIIIVKIVFPFYLTR